MNFTTTSQANLNAGVKILTYGESGMGKTMLVATLPAPLLISAESGLLSLSKENIGRVYGAGRPGICYDIPTIEVSCIEDVEQAYLWVTNPQNNPVNANGIPQFRSLAMDSVTEIAEKVLNNAKRSAKDPRQAYGELIERMETLVRAFRDLPALNIYMSSKMSRNKDEVTGITAYGPSMPGSKLGSAMPYFFDEVFKLAVGKDTNTQAEFRYIQTQPDLQNVCKDRSGKLDRMEQPHLGYIINKIKGVN